MIFHILTSVLIVLKLMGLIAASWFVVFLPSLVVFVFLLIAVAFDFWAMK
jgi:hypothetical protein